MLCPYEISHGIHNTVERIGVEKDMQTRNTIGPSKELGQEVDWNFQGPLHWSPEWLHQEHAHAPMVSTTTAGGTATTPLTAVTSQLRHVCIGTCVPRTT